MKSLSALILEKQKDLDIQGVTAKPMKPNDAAWARAMNEIDRLPENYRQLLTDALEGNTWKVRRFEFAGNTIINISRYPSPKIEIVLEIAEGKDGAVKRVRYFGFNNNNFSSYMREII